MSIKYLPKLAWRSVVKFSVARFFTAMRVALPAAAGQDLYVSIRINN